MPPHARPSVPCFRSAVLLAAALLAGAAANAAPQQPESRPVQTPEAFLLPKAVASFGAVTVGNELFVAGGHVGRKHVHSRPNVSDSVYHRPLAPGAGWTSEPGPPLQGLALVAHQGRLIRVGGLSPRNAQGEPEDLWSVDEVARREVASPDWTPLPPLPAPRSSHDAAVIGDVIVVAGGWKLAGTEKTWADQTCLLDLSSRNPAWKTVAQPFRRRALALAASRGRIWAIGGLDESGDPSRAVDVFDPASGSWSKGPDLPWPGFGAAACGDGTMLVASAIDGRVVRLDDEGRSWETIGALAVPRFFHRIVRGPDGTLWFVGGAARDGHSRLVEPFDPRSRASEGRFVRVRVPWPGLAKNRQGAVVRNGDLTLVGGNRSLAQHDFGPEDFLDEAWRLDFGSFEATRLPPLPTRRQSFVVAEAEARMPESASVAGSKRAKEERPAMLLGGFGREGDAPERSFKETYLLQRSGAAEPAGFALPEPLTQFGVAVRGDETWIFGGLDYDRSRPEKESFRHSDRVFVRKGGAGAFEDAGVRLPSPRRAFGYATLDGVVYVAGGLEEGFKVVDDFVALDLGTKEVRHLAKPAPRISPEMAALDGAIWLAGGASRAEKLPFLQRYDPRRDRWTTVATDPPFGPAHIRMAPWKGRLLFWSTHRKEPVIDLAWFVPPMSDAW